MNRLLAALVRLYQRTLSPDHGVFRNRYPQGYCRFTPTCSEYTREALLAHGTLRGLWFGGRRVLRCHPWAAGGDDPIPER